MHVFLFLLLIFGLQAEEMTDQQNLSHSQRNEALKVITHKVVTRGDLPDITVEKQLEIINQLTEFGLGRFLIERGGLNGYWTDYIIKHPTGKDLNSLEVFLLNQAPSVLATQQRFKIFKEEVQKRLHNGSSLASIPCGLMADLLDLDYSHTPDISITGIDLDLESIAHARQYSKKVHLEHLCTFSQQDAWALENDAEFDLITSNGLSIYEPDNAKVTTLYSGFWKVLKPGGILITSFLTPPSEWKKDVVNPEDARLQKIIFADILDCKWQIFRSEKEVKSQLETAGFVDIKIIYDTAHIFPTIIARKTL